MDLTFQPAKCFLLLAVTLLGVLVFRIPLKNEFERQFLYFGALGVFVWSGIGGTLQMVGWKYMALFTIFFLTIFGFFTLTMVMLNKFIKPIRFFEGEALVSERLWQVFLGLFLVFSLFPLVYPEFQLTRLFRPPSPDLVQKIDENLKETGDSTPEILYYYMSVLLFPFFLFSLSSLGRRWWLVVPAVIFYYYVRYCVDEYLPRHEIGLVLILLFLYLWNQKIFPRHYLAASCMFALPALLLFFNMYTKLRQGAGIELGLNFFGVLESVFTLFYQETFYPILVHDLMESQHANEILRYLKWIVSLPIPQSLTESWDYLKINHEFTELLTGKVYGQTTTHIYLPGLFGEGLFIYGSNLFWVHSCSVGILTALICFLMKSDRRLFFLMTFFQLQVLLLARGGISLILILVVNYFLLFWPFLFLLIRRSRAAERSLAHAGPMGPPPLHGPPPGVVGPVRES